MPRPNARAANRQRIVDFRPRTRMALQLYATGAAKTLGEAADTMGVSRSGVYIAHSTLSGQELMTRMTTDIEERTLDMSKLLQKLGREAVITTAGLMRSAGSENIKLAAAKDLADRNPETSKIQKIQVEPFTLDPLAGKALAAALVEASMVKDRFASASQKDLIKIEQGSYTVLPGRPTDGQSGDVLQVEDSVGRHPDGAA